MLSFSFNNQTKIRKRVDLIIKGEWVAFVLRISVGSTLHSFYSLEDFVIVILKLQFCSRICTHYVGIKSIQASLDNDDRQKISDA